MKDSKCVMFLDGAWEECLIPSPFRLLSQNATRIALMRLCFRNIFGIRETGSMGF